MAEQTTVSISPAVEIGELKAQQAFLINRNLILAQALNDALEGLKAAQETIAQRDAEIAKLDALREPPAADTEH